MQKSNYNNWRFPMNNKITNTDINEFEEFLINKNKSRITLDKYMRDIRRFQIFLSDNSYQISQDTADKYIEFLKMLITV